MWVVQYTSCVRDGAFAEYVRLSSHLDPVMPARNLPMRFWSQTATVVNTLEMTVLRSDAVRANQLTTRAAGEEISIRSPSLYISLLYPLDLLI